MAKEQAYLVTSHPLPESGKSTDIQPPGEGWTLKSHETSGSLFVCVWEKRGINRLVDAFSQEKKKTEE